MKNTKKIIALSVAILSSNAAWSASNQTNQWKEVGTYTKEAAFVNISELPFNKVLLNGGGQWDSSGCNISFNNSMQYDLNTKKTSAVANMKVARSYFSSIALDDGKVLTLGSGNDCTSSSDAKNSEIYNPTTQKWTSGAVSNNGFGVSAVMRLNNGQILFAGGYWNHSPRESAELYDQRTNKFVKTGNMNIRNIGGFAFGSLLDGRAIVAGGSNFSWGAGTEFVGSAEVFNPTMGKWSYVAELNTARNATSGVTLSDGRFFVVGGNTENGVTDSAEIYDPKTDEWTVVSGTLNKARQNHKVVLLANGDVLVIGGSDKDGVAVAETEIFSPKNESFELAGNLNKPRTAYFSALRTRDGNVIIAGGMNGAKYVSAIEVFSPSY